MFNIGNPVSFYTTTSKQGPIRILEFTWWPLFVRLSKMKLPSYFEDIRFSEKLLWGHDDSPRSWSYCEVGPKSSQINWYATYPPYIVISPWDTYMAYSTNPWMVVSINNVGDFKTYLWDLYQCRHLFELTYRRQKQFPLLFGSHVVSTCSQRLSMKTYILSQRDYKHDVGCMY